MRKRPSQAALLLGGPSARRPFAARCKVTINGVVMTYLHRITVMSRLIGLRPSAPDPPAVAVTWRRRSRPGLFTGAGS